MKISVVVCTFNGEKYIIEQLQSIYQQTTMPDEVIIQDDCSTDRTRELIEKFIRNHNLQNEWTLICNKENMGWKKNFMNAISKASGDLIFLSDQDDIWYLDKIEKMAGICIDNPQIELLFSELKAFNVDNFDCNSLLVMMLMLGFISLYMEMTVLQKFTWKDTLQNAEDKDVHMQ